MENRATPLQVAASASAALVAAGGRIVGRVGSAPSAESSVKFAGGVVAALLAIKYAGSLKSACVIGLLSGLFAHSLYADVLVKRRQKKRKALAPPPRRRSSGGASEKEGSDS